MGIMYKQTILLSLFTLTAVSQATSLEDMGRYYQLTEKHKADMFVNQGGLMNEKAYSKFIAPFILQAEASLEIMGSFKKDGISKAMEPLARSYFELLATLNLEAFKEHLYINYRCFSASAFRCKIIEIKKAKNLYSLDVDKEVQKTLALLREANEAFYKKLSFMQRLTLRFYA